MFGMKARRNRLNQIRDFEFLKSSSPDPNAPAFTQGASELCGGCGKMKTPAQIEACAGEVCHDYVSGLRGHDMEHSGYGPSVSKAKPSVSKAKPYPSYLYGTFETPQRKIPIGYKGHLHTDRK